MTLLQKIGLNIKRMRKESRFSQEWLANEAGISPTYLRSIERGVANPTINILDKISNQLNVDILELLR